MSHPRVYWTADRSALVEESDSRAAYLAYGEADTISPEHLALLGKKLAAAAIAETPTLPDEPVESPVVAPVQPTAKPSRRR